MKILKSTSTKLVVKRRYKTWLWSVLSFLLTSTLGVVTKDGIEWLLRAAWEMLKRLLR